MRLVPALVLACCLVLSGCMASSGKSERGTNGPQEAVSDLTDETFVRRASSLVQAGDFGAVVKLARAYRAKVGERNSSADLSVLIEADALRLDSKADVAWKVFQTVSDPDAYPAPWTRTGMDILYDLGRKDEAYEFCADNISRIPQPHLRRGVREMCVQRSLQ